MDLNLLYQKDLFPRFVMNKLATAPVDYKEKNFRIDQSRQEGSAHLKAAVVLLLNFKRISSRSEYVFQLIKRSRKVSQGGDISCPGGMLQPKQDNFLSSLLNTGIIPAFRGNLARRIQNVDSETASLIRLFLTNALREAWEEIGLNPLNTKFLGALPSYSLSLLARTIFPVVCVTRKPFRFKLSSEVEKILEIPVSFFFRKENYGMLDIHSSLGDHSESLNYQMPCLVIPDGSGNNDILWGATFNIIHNFLNIISDNSVPSDYSSRKLTKVLTLDYISPRR